MVVRVRWELPAMQFEQGDNQLPPEIKKTLRLSMLDLEFSGHRRLKFFPAEKASDLSFLKTKGESGAAQPPYTVHTQKDTFWYYDFPNRMKDLKKVLSQ